jgi:DNA-binding phage protein
MERLQEENIMNNMPYAEFLEEKLNDPEFAMHYLMTYLEDGSPEEVAEALAKILRTRKRSEIPRIYEQILQQNWELLRDAGMNISITHAT